MFLSLSPSLEFEKSHPRTLFMPDFVAPFNELSVLKVLLCCHKGTVGSARMQKPDVRCTALMGSFRADFQGTLL